MSWPDAFLMAFSTLSLGMFAARAFWMTRRRAGFDSGFGPPFLTAIVISLPMRENSLDMRSQRANIVALRVSKMRPMGSRKEVGVTRAGRPAQGSRTAQHSRRGARVQRRARAKVGMPAWCGSCITARTQGGRYADLPPFDPAAGAVRESAVGAGHGAPALREGRTRRAARRGWAHGAEAPVARQSQVPGQHKVRRGAEVHRPGHEPELRVQPHGGGSRIRRGRATRSALRDGVLGPGTR